MEENSLTVSELLSQNELLEILNNVDGGYKSSKDAFYEDGNKLLNKFTVQGVLTVEDEEDHHLRNSVICNVLGCNQQFETVFAFESHYNTLHRYLCSICKKNLPSPYLLDLHLSEQHDSFFAAQAERNPMYSCFIQECKEKFANPEERKDHSFRLHKFPINFRFDNSTTLTGSMKKEGKQSPIDNKMMDISPTSSISDNKESSPPSITKITNFTFGHQKTKVFNSSNYAKILTKNKSKIKKSNTTKSSLDDDKMVSDLMDSLPITN